MELTPIENKIIELRGKQVMLDSDLAEIYGIETRRLKEQVRRNVERFPEDFMFELTKQEYELLRSQNATLNSKYLPFVFTQEGVAMLSGVLRTPLAIQVNINIMRAFVAVRSYLQYGISSKQFSELNERILNIERNLRDHIKDWEDSEFDNEKKFDELYAAFAKLAANNQLDKHKPPRRPVGYIQPKDETD